MLKKILCLSVVIASACGISNAAASERYRTVAPVVLGHGLTAPWVNQLSGGAPDDYPRVRARVPMQVQVRGQVQVQRQYPVQTRAVRQPLFGAPRTAVRVPRQQQVQQVAYQNPANPVRSQLDPQFLPQEVEYKTNQKPGTVVIDTEDRFLYFVEGNGRATRYGVGVGKPGFEWAGAHKVTRKAEWPGWTPPKEMITREAAKGHYLPAHMEGGPANPLGARAMYIGSTEYRIHGTNAPWTIGYAVSSGCIRMRNEDVTKLYERVKVGATVIVK